VTALLAGHAEAVTFSYRRPHTGGLSIATEFDRLLDFGLGFAPTFDLTVPLPTDRQNC
jgi:hypothetical protein